MTATRCYACFPFNAKMKMVLIIISAPAQSKKPSGTWSHTTVKNAAESGSAVASTVVSDALKYFSPSK